MPSTPQLSDESVLSILDGMSWDDIEEEEGKGQEQEQSLNTDSLMQENQQEVEVFFDFHCWLSGNFPDVPLDIRSQW